LEGNPVIRLPPEHPAAVAASIADNNGDQVNSGIFGLCRVAATDRSRGFQPTVINRKNGNKSRSDD
jgi:hypothetical protein